MRLHGSLEPTHRQSLRLATESDAPALRVLLNRAFKELADKGLNFTGSYQDEALTLERMRNATVYLLEDIEGIYATISLKESLSALGAKYLFISQVAVCPKRQKQGVGSFLMKFAEDEARQRGIQVLRLNTAIPATHLVSFYKSLQFRVIDNVQFENKSYRSFVLEKWVPVSVMAKEREVTLRPCSESDAPEISKLCWQLGYSVSAEVIETSLEHMHTDQNQIFVVHQNTQGSSDTITALDGFVHVQKVESIIDHNSFEIMALVVEETARSLGFGRLLLGIAEKWGKLHERRTALVRSSTARIRAHHFYTNHMYKLEKTSHLFKKQLGETR